MLTVLQIFHSGFDAPSSVQRFPTHGCFPLSPSHVYRSASSQGFCRKTLTLSFPCHGFTVSFSVLAHFGRDFDDERRREKAFGCCICYVDFVYQIHLKYFPKDLSSTTPFSFKRKGHKCITNLSTHHSLVNHE